jgi:cyclophilin family peptidyl-prolyl cis-trans isomerase
MPKKKPRATPLEPKVTAFCELKVKVGNLNSVKAKRIVIGVYEDEAPVLVRNFMEACSGRYPGEAATQVNYFLSDVKKIQKDKVITWADFKDGNTFTRQQLSTVNGKAWVTTNNKEVPLAGKDTRTDETNNLRHEKEGTVSMRRGGGTFDFNVAPVDNANWLDKDNVVIGRVLEGMETIKVINKVPVSPGGKPEKKIRCVNSTLSILDESTGQFNALKRLAGVTDFFA